jgi:hypothetical protein
MAILAAAWIAVGAGAVSLQPHTSLGHADFVIPGGPNDALGYTMSAGRWTTDNLDDLLICSMFNNSCWMFFGRPATTGNPWMEEPDVAFIGMGSQWIQSASFVGDINGDGLEDVAIGAPYGPWSQGEASAGSVWIFLSRGDSFRGPIGYYEANTTIFGIRSNDGLGASVTRGGDVNRDGHDDFWIGAPGFQDDAGQIGVGAAFLMLGSPIWPTELTSAAAATRIVGAAPGGWFGSVLQGDEDLNGDGELDLFTSSPAYPNATGVVVGAAFVFTGPFADDGSTLSASQARVTLWGNSMIDPFGQSIAVARGFLQGDARTPYLLVTGSLWNGYCAGVSTFCSMPLPWGAGSVHVYGVSNWTCCQELNSWDAVGLLYTADPNDGWQLWLGAGGDVDGDGRDDVLVGAPQADVGLSWSVGRVSVVYGGVLTSEPYLISNATSAIEGRADWTHLGYAVLLCDFNGDGKADIFAGAPGDGRTGPSAGMVVGFLGRPRNRAPMVDLSATGELLEGSGITVRATMSDPDGDPVSWQWVTLGEPVTVNGTLTTNLTVVYADEGSYQVLISVSDGELPTRAFQALAVLNAPPRCSIEVPHGFVEGEPGVVFINVTDPGFQDGWIVDWRGPQGMSFNHTSGWNFALRGDDFTVRAIVADGDGGSGSCERFVDIENVAPTVSLSGPGELLEGTTGVYAAGVIDPGSADKFEYVWQGPGAAAGPNGYAWYPVQPGVYQIRVDVFDLDGGQGTATREVRVLSAPPVVDLVGPVLVSEGDAANFSVEQQAGQSFDPLMVSWKGCGLGFDAGISWSIPRAIPGSFCVEARVADDDGDMVVLRRTLTVANRAPLAGVQATPPGPYFEGTRVDFEAFLGEWETGPVAFEWVMEGQLKGTAAAVTVDLGEGLHRLSLVAKDRDGGVSFFNASLDIENRAPEVRIEGMEQLLPGASGTWNAIARDASGIAPQLSWEVDGNPAASGPRLVWSWNAHGTHEIRVTADDGRGGVTVASRIVTVEPTPPLSAGLDLRWALVLLGAAAAFAAGILVGGWAYGRWKERRLEGEEKPAIASTWRR